MTGRSRAPSVCLVNRGVLAMARDRWRKEAERLLDECAALPRERAIEHLAAAVQAAEERARSGHVSDGDALAVSRMAARVAARDIQKRLTRAAAVVGTEEGGAVLLEYAGRITNEWGYAP